MGLSITGLSINCSYTKNNFKVAFFLFFFRQIGSKLKGFKNYFQQVTKKYKGIKDMVFKKG
jgi:hypothetical protein